MERSLQPPNHIKPKSQGGSDDPSNLQGCCRLCNLRKAQGEASANTPKSVGFFTYLLIPNDT
ncbi:MAG: HNH endonuclease signature motif containing protein [Sedimenticola sp.]